jgi:hypothetical protein
MCPPKSRPIRERVGEVWPKVGARTFDSQSARGILCSCKPGREWNWELILELENICKGLSTQKPINLQAHANRFGLCSQALGANGKILHFFSLFPTRPNLSRSVTCVKYCKVGEFGENSRHYRHLLTHTFQCFLCNRTPFCIVRRQVVTVKDT